MKIGITGGIGSGKTTICKIFEVLGIPVYYADDRAKRLMVENEILKKGIIELFGKNAYLENGELNRAHIAGIAFKDANILKALNNLVHPAVHKDANEWADAQTDAPYSLREAALIFEGGGYKLLDKVITVFAPKEVRIERVMARDKVDKAAVEARISKQMPDEEKIKLADFVIINDGKTSLVEQVVKIHRLLNDR
ncbi:MAG: dephospho-CoA kinase [Saprospiraceae bacterium]